MIILVFGYKIPYNLCVHFVYSQRLFCSWKIGILNTKHLFSFLLSVSFEIYQFGVNMYKNCNNTEEYCNDELVKDQYGSILSKLLLTTKSAM